MKQFIVKVVVFSLSFFILDKLFIISRNISPAYDWDRRLERVLEGELNKKLIVFGSSRGADDIATWQLEKELGVDSYNLSYQGSEIEFQTFVLKQLLSNNEKPDLILKIVDDDFELSPSPYNDFRIDRLVPIVKYPAIREELVERGEKNLILSKLFVLHQLSLSNFDMRLPDAVNDTLKEFGNLPTMRSPDSHSEWVYGTKTFYDEDQELSIKLESFKEFQNLCLQNNIKLIIAIPPSYQLLNTQFSQRIKKLMDKNVYFHIYDQTRPEYKSKEYFNDGIHLNPKGAEIYTQDLISFIKSRSLMRTNQIVPESEK